MVPPPAEPPYLAFARSVAEEEEAAEEGAARVAQAQRDEIARASAEWLARRREKHKAIVAPLNPNASDSQIIAAPPGLGNMFPKIMSPSLRPAINPHTTPSK